MGQILVDVSSWVFDLVTAAGTLIAAGAAVWAAFQAQKSSAHSAATAAAATEALSAALRPEWAVQGPTGSNSGVHVQITPGNGRAALDVTATLFWKGAPIGSAETEFLPPFSTAENFVGFTVPVSRRGFSLNDPPIDAIFIEATDYRSVGRWRYRYLFERNNWSWNLANIDYLGMATGARA